MYTQVLLQVITVSSEAVPSQRKESKVVEGVTKKLMRVVSRYSRFVTTLINTYLNM